MSSPLSSDYEDLGTNRARSMSFSGQSGVIVDLDGAASDSLTTDEV